MTGTSLSSLSAKNGLTISPANAANTSGGLGTLAPTSGAVNVVTANAKFVRAKIRFASQVFRHKLETGETVIDSRCVMPIDIDIDVWSPDRDTVEALNVMQQDRQNLFNVAVRGLIFTPMILQMEEFKHSAQALSATRTQLKFKQLITSAVSGGNVSQASDSNTSQQGIAGIGQAVSGAVANVSNTLTGLFTSVSNSINGLI